MFENLKSIKEASNYLKIEVSELVRYICAKGYRFEEYISIVNKNFERCTIEKSFFEEILKIFAYRIEKTDDIDKLKKYHTKIIASREEIKYYRTEKAKKYISKYNPGNDSYESGKNLKKNKKREFLKWREEKKEEKKKKIENKLEGTDISVKIDREGRILYYKTPGNWISHERAKEKMKEVNKESEESGEERENEERGTFEASDQLPF